MDDAFVMRRFKGLRDLPGDVERLIDWNRPASDALVQTLAVDEFEHEELRAVDLFEAVDLRDVRMVERGEHLGFTVEAGDALGIVGEGSRQDLQGNVATELRVLGAVDFAHAASTKRGENT